MVDVFISYPQRERTLMLPIKERLEALGLILFVDVDGRLDGEAAFPDALDKGVRASKAVLGCWSPWALTREWVKNECAIGKDENKLVAVERVVLTGSDVPAEFYRVDRKPLTDFDGTAPHEGWAMTLTALATKLKLWEEKRPDHPEVAAVREKIVVLEKAAAAERAALGAQRPSPVRGGATLPVGQSPADKAWVGIERSLDASHYRRFERTFETDPAAFLLVIEAEARAKALERWAATDRQDASAIAETLRTGLYPALQEVAEQALATAEAEAEARERAEEQERQARARAEAERSAKKKAAVEQTAAKFRAEGRVQVEAAIFPPDNSEAAQAGWLKPGAGKTEWFKDLEIAPEMVVVPGTPAFSIGRFALTFAEWDAAQAHPEWQKHSGIAARKANDHGWGRGKQPVIDVSWHDAKSYCAWLSKVTSKTYRLPTEAEWEYCCRAGTTTEFWWGNEISTSQANYDGNFTFGNGKKGEYRQRTVPVDSFDANPWGLYQVHGNVWEWCEDHFDTSSRVLRGGSWYDDPDLLRSAGRGNVRPGNRHVNIGFRVARTL
ncbi:MAG: SUMF1/EgtB/PvdO family nonheme iron enzyme [Hyphomicrobium aestuarii]|nr:SUMF1/EgtB/PvdO family nonheme iron enzyme [Hyphomicrobium aestuarii]